MIILNTTEHILYLLYTCIHINCFYGKYASHNIHTKPVTSGIWVAFFHILTREDINDFTDMMFIPLQSN